MNPYWENHNHRKLDPHDIYLIKELRREGLKIKAIAEKFEVTTSHVSKVLRGIAWRDHQ